MQPVGEHGRCTPAGLGVLVLHGLLERPKLAHVGQDPHSRPSDIEVTGHKPPLEQRDESLDQFVLVTTGSVSRHIP